MKKFEMFLPPIFTFLWVVNGEHLRESLKGKACLLWAARLGICVPHKTFKAGLVFLLSPLIVCGQKGLPSREPINSTPIALAQIGAQWCRPQIKLYKQKPVKPESCLAPQRPFEPGVVSITPAKWSLSTKLLQLQMLLVHTTAPEFLRDPLCVAKGKEEQVPLIPSYWSSMWLQVSCR